eukprot:CAMPEP_0117676968 /NCGR_PEP_ID=MMETSP0804-20121206/16494_1 /TAXON_ID=1074897 /ORGANISM="Tetraselmis astigmatica, Strain CCMP880" /LENGTH=86 /DNA_ID=CAMNT_0005486219 /DNA_START=744 /DNA_END=1005 /DNA_ORIENTATION=+
MTAKQADPSSADYRAHGTGKAMEALSQERKVADRAAQYDMMQVGALEAATSPQRFTPFTWGFTTVSGLLQRGQAGPAAQQVACDVD